MLRTRVRRTTASTGVTLTVTHGLGAVPDLWSIEPLSDRGVGRTYVVPATVLTNLINIVNSISTTVTVDVFCINWQGRLY
jgi:hypothetical protein